jgi:hypothetical protein
MRFASLVTFLLLALAAGASLGVIIKYAVGYDMVVTQTGEPAEFSPE